MDDHSTTTAIQDVIHRRVETSLADLLLDMYHAGYCAGAGLPMELPTAIGTADLVLLTEARHRVELRAPRGWDDPPTNADELPGWLLTQSQQADPVRLRAEAEREIALGDARAPDGWHTAPLKRGAP